MGSPNLHAISILFARDVAERERCQQGSCPNARVWKFFPHWTWKRFRHTTLFATPLTLEGKPQRQLPDTSIYSCATDDAKRGRCEIRVGVRKLTMVQCIAIV